MNTKLILGGDGRADSPGHCTKYGSYTVMKLHKHAVIDVQLVAGMADTAMMLVCIFVCQDYYVCI